MKIIKGDITNISDGVILHQVNCQNDMDAGVAKAVYTKWPKVKSEYHAIFENNTPEKLYKTMQEVNINKNLIIVNSFTQFDYLKPLSNEKHLTNEVALINNIKKSAELAKHKNKKVYIPEKIGCGLGGGDWNIILNAVSDIDNLTIVKFGE